MADQEHSGPGGGPEEGPDPTVDERSESLREPSADEPEELGEAATEITRFPEPSTPSPREQWFGGFDGAAPPPPPYARLPESGSGGESASERTPPRTPPWTPPSGSARPHEGAPPPEAGTGVSAPPPTGEDDPVSDPPEEELGAGTVRLLPGPRNRRPVRPTRPTRPGGDAADPLGPRKLRGDSDVPEPEQLPPLETERDEFSGATPAGAEARTDAIHPRVPGGQGSESGGTPPLSPGPAPSTTPDPPPQGPAASSPWAPSAAGRRGGSTAPPPSAPSGPSTAPRWDQGRPSTEPGETSDSLNAATLVRNRRQGPSTGWRKAVHAATLGLVNPGESARVLRRQELVARATTPVASGHHRVAVLSLKGGVGKTTTTVALGATLGSLRGDRVLAVDANPDRGTLSDKVRLETAATIRDLLNERHLVARYADIRGFTSQAPSRLEILASDRDPAVSEAFSDADYREVARIVEHFYSICITDCGTGLLHSAMRGVLGLADQVVLVSSASVDGARSASATLDWLEAHGHGSLVRGAVVVLSMVRSNSKSSVDLGRLEEHFAGRCRAVVRVPWDGHLEEGAEVDLEQLAPATRDAYLQLAASVGEAFGR
ncbi:MinD-like ATPase involved in chromosome partitioning or flagellar assembly [Nocardiopsis sp. Huas11]|uniref:MinD/ParA family ATP-binding protein n=1 Tax=Nocardiopsis sp. Huas11 TaxID=2183912 RepID=UPI000EB065C8|nr:MinD/ParA family protein [Nocardiopsis sp. Huas11]RKS06489.1 MinD-like ATPase involved in chromosome partitioning or flagellar assembly [Nocardiopsis sp. Huas11]